MNEQIYHDILHILQQALLVIKRYDIAALAELSNHINHNASIFQDEDSISVALVIYALSKIFYREEHIDPGLVRLLSRSYDQLKEKHINAYRKTIKRLIHKIKVRDKQLGFYLTSVFEKAGIKKGTKLYYNGISLARVAELMGITQWELLHYLGKTTIEETFEKTPRLRQRIAYARKLFHVME